MNCLRFRPHTLPLSSPFSVASVPLKNAYSAFFRKPYRFSSPRMSSSPASSPSQIIEHLVLVKVKEGTEPSKVSAMLGGLDGLKSLDPVLHLTAGPVLRCGSTSFSFTHMLHSRYSSKEGLAAYSAHPEHLRVVRESLLPIIDDLIAVDWVSEGFSGSVALPPGSAFKISFLKLKENAGEQAKEEVLGVIRSIKDDSAYVQQLSCGENFSPARAKGFSIASLAVFKGAAEMEAALSNVEFVESRKEKVRDYLDGVITINYVSQGSASL